MPNKTQVLPPMSVLLELTHRCPMQCAYCANPLNLLTQKEERDTEFWLSVIEQASELGALHVHFSGGEPLVRGDLAELVAKASSLGLYTNLITSGLGLSEDRLRELDESGLDHVQLSFQDITELGTQKIAGVKGALERKFKAAELLNKAGMPLTLNFVIWRDNIEHIPQMLELAKRFDAERIELANVQYHGWAQENKSGLLPSREQLLKADEYVESMRDSVPFAIDWVTPDYLQEFPKPCMGGWGKRFINIVPNGNVLPCHGAEIFAKKVDIPNASTQSLRDIWHDSRLFNLYRGTAWIKKPCQGCERVEIDFGGCRCQALAMTGDGDNADPVCGFSPYREIVDKIVEDSHNNQGKDFKYRRISRV